MKRLHFISGLTIIQFVGFHLLNHVCSIFDAGKHIEIMSLFGLFYSNIFVETILLSAVLVQFFSGLILFKTNIKTATSNFEKLHIWTGIYLAIFFVIHLNAVLVGRYILHLKTNFYFGVDGLNLFPFNLFYIPCYALSIFSFFGYFACIHIKKMKYFIFGLTSKRQSKVITLFDDYLTIIIFYGLINRFKGLKILTKCNVLIGKQRS